MIILIAELPSVAIQQLAQQNPTMLRRLKVFFCIFKKILIYAHLWLTTEIT